MVTTPTQPNAELAYRVLDHIDAHPEQHRQGLWWQNPGPHCGTAGCFAGWAVALSGGRMIQRGEMTYSVYVESGLSDLNGRHVSLAAAELLGIAEVEYQDQAEELPLFHEDNTREDLGRLVAEIFGPRPAQLPAGEWQACPTCGDPLTTGCRPANGLCVVDDDVPPSAGSTA